MEPRRSLTEILRQDKQSVTAAWDATQAAAEFSPLPSGEYIAQIVRGELSESKKGTPGYKLTFEVLEGEHTGRRFWYDLWLTTAALPMTKRDLGKLNITQLEQLEKPLPRGFRCKVNLTLREEDDGTKYNRVRRFEVLSFNPPEPDPFAPKEVDE